MKMTLIILTILSLFSLGFSETPAKCKARCFNENTKCCHDYPNEKGTKCYAEARSCYNKCQTLKFLE